MPKGVIATTLAAGDNSRSKRHDRKGNMMHDKADWHFEGEFPRELDQQQAYVPGGLLVAWLAARDLLSSMAEEDFADELARLRARSMTGPRAYRLLGGVLESDLLDDEADAFFSAYLDPDGGGYWTDYGALAAGLPSQYHVPDGWPSYDSIAPSIDASFARWRAKAGKPPGA
jgi:hypothetical protein